MSIYPNYKELASALYVLNKHAKTKRDDKNHARYCEGEWSGSDADDVSETSSDEYQAQLDKIYNLKNRIMNKLIANKSMKLVGWHKSHNGYYGTTYWVLYSFCGISFHHIGDSSIEGNCKKLSKLDYSISADCDTKKSKGLTVCQAIRILKSYEQLDKNIVFVV